MSCHMLLLLLMWGNSGPTPLVLVIDAPHDSLLGHRDTLVEVSVNVNRFC